MARRKRQYGKIYTTSPDTSPARNRSHAGMNLSYVRNSVRKARANIAAGKCRAALDDLSFASYMSGLYEAHRIAYGHDVAAGSGVFKTVKAGFDTYYAKCGR